MPNPESVARDYLHRGRGADRRTEPGGLVFSRHKEKVMRRYLSLAALGAALLMSGCIVPVDRYHEGRGYYGNRDRGDDCRDRDRDRCGRRDRVGDGRDDHDRPWS
jgi:hypothetical protein